MMANRIIMVTRFFREILLFAVMAGLIFGWVISCSKKDPPSQVVREALTAADEGKYLEADKYLASILLERRKSKAPQGKVTDLSKEFWDGFTRNRTIEKIETFKEQILDDKKTAIVDFSVHFKDGSAVDNTAVLDRKRNIWKIFILGAEGC